MSKRALILGGTGLIGRAAARRLRAHGWTVDAPGREVNREDPKAIARALSDGLCYAAEHARALLPPARHAASTVMISAKAVDVDDEGRHVNSPKPPRFAGPVTEDQPTTAPGSGDFMTREGHGANKVAAERTLLDSGRWSGTSSNGSSPGTGWCCSLTGARASTTRPPRPTSPR